MKLVSLQYPTRITNKRTFIVENNWTKNESFFRSKGFLYIEVMKFENWFAALLKIIMIIVNILSPLIVWYFFFKLEEYRAILLLWGVIQTWIGYNTVKGVLFESDW